MGRHGEGHHNVAEGFYGTDAWDVCEVPTLNRRGEMLSDLTPDISATGQS